MFIKDLTVQNFNWSNNDFKAVHDYRLMVKSLIWGADLSTVAAPAESPNLQQVTRQLQKGANPGEYIITDDIITADIIAGCAFTVAGYSGVAFKSAGGQLLAALSPATSTWPNTVMATYWIYIGAYNQVGATVGSPFDIDLSNRRYDIKLNEAYEIPPAPGSTDNGKVLTVVGSDLVWAAAQGKAVTSANLSIDVNETATEFDLAINQNQTLQALTLGIGSGSYKLPTSAPGFDGVYGISFTNVTGIQAQNAAWASPSGILEEWHAGQFSSVQIGSAQSSYQLPATMPATSGLSYLTFNNGVAGWGSVPVATGNSVFQSGNGVTVNQTVAQGGGSVFTFDLNSTAQFTNLSIGSGTNSYLMPTAPPPHSVMFLLSDGNKNVQWRGVSTGPGLATSIDTNNLTFSIDDRQIVPIFNVQNLRVYTNAGGVMPSLPGHPKPYYALPAPYSGPSAPTGRLLGLDSVGDLGWREIAAGNNIAVNASDSGLTIGVTDTLSLSSGNIILSSTAAKFGTYSLPAPNIAPAVNTYLKYNGNGACSWSSIPAGGGSTTVEGTDGQITVSDVAGGYKISLPNNITFGDPGTNPPPPSTVTAGINGYFINNIADGATTILAMNAQDNNFSISTVIGNTTETNVLISKDEIQFGAYKMPDPNTPPSENLFLKHVSGGICSWEPVVGGGSITVSGTENQIIVTPNSAGYTISMPTYITDIAQIAVTDLETGSGAININYNKITQSFQGNTVLFTPALRYAPFEEARTINGITLITPIDERFVKQVTVTAPDVPNLLYALTPEIDPKYTILVEIITGISSAWTTLTDTSYKFTVVNGLCIIVDVTGDDIKNNYRITYYEYVGNSLKNGNVEPNPVLELGGPEICANYGLGNNAPTSVNSAIIGKNNNIYSTPAYNGTEPPLYLDQKITFTCTAPGTLTTVAPAMRYGPYDLSGCLGVIEMSPAPQGADFTLYDSDGQNCGVLSASTVSTDIGHISNDIYDNNTTNVLTAANFTNLNVTIGDIYYITFKINPFQLINASNTIIGTENKYTSQYNIGEADVTSGAMASIVGNINNITGTMISCAGNANVIDGIFNTVSGSYNISIGDASCAFGNNNKSFNSIDLLCGRSNVTYKYNKGLVLDGNIFTSELLQLHNNTIETDRVADIPFYNSKIYAPFNYNLTVTNDAPANNSITWYLTVPKNKTVKTILSALNPITVYLRDTEVYTLIPQPFAGEPDLNITYGAGGESNVLMTTYDPFRNCIVLTTTATTSDGQTAVNITNATITGFQLTNYVEYTGSTVIGSANRVNYESASIIGCRNTVTIDKIDGRSTGDLGTHFIAGNDNLINAPATHDNVIIGTGNMLNNCAGTSLIGCKNTTVSNLVNTTIVGMSTAPQIPAPPNCVVVPSLQINGSVNELITIADAGQSTQYILNNLATSNLLVVSPITELLIMPPAGGYTVGWKLTVRLKAHSKGGQFRISSSDNHFYSYCAATQQAGEPFYTYSTDSAYFILNSPIITVIAIDSTTLLCENL